MVLRRGLPILQSGRTLEEGETEESFLDQVEASARRIVGKISKSEYVARRTALGNMPWFNCVFEEMGINHDEYVIPSNVLLSLEKKKDSAKNLIAVAESKKRRGAGVVKAVAKKQKADVAMEVVVESSSDRSSITESNPVETPATKEVPSTPVGVVLVARFVAMEAVSRGAVSAQEPLALNPMLSLLGEDSSHAEAPPVDPPR